MSRITPSRIRVLNTPCTLFTKESLREAICHRALQTRYEPLSIDFTNVHIVAMRSVHADFLGSTGNVDWFVSDSQILTWSISWLGGRDHERIYGPEFLAYFFSAGHSPVRHAFIGGSQDCLTRLCGKIHELDPLANVVYRRNGYFKPEDEDAIIDEINASKADILWVGLGTPKQQEWIGRNKDRLRVKVILAVGFAFDVNAGTKTDAPKWLGPLGLTWLYRFACEPRRLWKRYTYYNSVFITKLFRQVATDDTVVDPAP